MCRGRKGGRVGVGGGCLFEFEWEWEGRWGAGGRLFEARRLLTFPASRMGAYSRWALIRVWALIRINITLFRLARKSKQSGIFGRVLYGY